MIDKPFQGASETAVRLMLRYPWFMVLYYSMGLFEMQEMPPPFNTLATNGVSLWINKKFWDQLDRDQKMTAIAHELGHKMYLHTTRRGDRIPALFNIAGDHRINNDLVKAGFKPLAGMVINDKPWTWCCDKKYEDEMKWTTEAIYDDLLAEYEERRSGKDKDKEIGEMAAEDLGDAADICDFGTKPDGSSDEGEGEGKARKESPDQFEGRVRKELKEAEQTAQMAGNCPAFMKRAVASADIVHVKWYEVMEQYLKALVVSDYSWSRVDRRHFVKTGTLSPDMWSPAMGGIAVFVDCSGSIDEQTIGKFDRHFKDIVEQTKPKRVDVRYFETVVDHRHDQTFERADPDVQLQPSGGGGTAITWLADEIDDLEEKPEVAIVLTDMYVGEFGREPDVPVLWLSISSIDKAPFGEVLSIN